MDNDTTGKMDALIKSQILKFKPAKKRKRLSKERKASLDIKSTGKSIKQGPKDPIEISLEKIFEPADPLALALAQADIDPAGKAKLAFYSKPPFDEMKPNETFLGELTTLYKGDTQELVLPFRDKIST